MTGYAEAVFVHLKQPELVGGMRFMACFTALFLGSVDDFTGECAAVMAGKAGFPAFT